MVENRRFDNTDEGTGNGETTGEQHLVRNTARQIKDGASRAAMKAGERVTGRLDEQRDTLASRISKVAACVRKTGESLERDEESAIGEYVCMAADRIDGAGSYVRDHSLRDLQHDAAQFVRRYPFAILAGAFVGGLVLARFLRSSAEHDHTNDDAWDGDEDVNQWSSNRAHVGIVPVSGPYSSGPSSPGHAMARQDGKTSATPLNPVPPKQTATAAHIVAGGDACGL